MHWSVAISRRPNSLLALGAPLGIPFCRRIMPIPSEIGNRRRIFLSVPRCSSRSSDTDHLILFSDSAPPPPLSLLPDSRISPPRGPLRRLLDFHSIPVSLVDSCSVKGSLYAVRNFFVYFAHCDSSLRPLGSENKKSFGGIRSFTSYPFNRQSGTLAVFIPSLFE